jgi:hypothetical protein
VIPQSQAKRREKKGEPTRILQNTPWLPKDFKGLLQPLILEMN